jgi:hypothetical protein
MGGYIITEYCRRKTFRRSNIFNAKINFDLTKAIQHLRFVHTVDGKLVARLLTLFQDGPRKNMPPSR